ncbi:MAG TPA: hypothetical protein VF170_01250 [Planctomycetaceae bacterium]
MYVTRSAALPSMPLPAAPPKASRRRLALSAALLAAGVAPRRPPAAGPR